MTPASFISVLELVRRAAEGRRSPPRARPTGSPPPSGLMISQKSVWFAWPPPLLRTAARIVLGHRRRGSAGRPRRSRSAHSVPVERLVQVVDVGLVVLAVVDLHRAARRCAARARRRRSGRSGRVKAIRLLRLGQVGVKDMLRAVPDESPKRQWRYACRRYEEIRPRELKPALLELDGISRAADRGPLQALPGLRRQAERDPRQARRRRPRQREPGLLRAPRAQGRSHLRASAGSRTTRSTSSTSAATAATRTARSAS